MGIKVIIALLALIVIVVIGIFNRLIRCKNLMKEGWSGIDVQLKRRHDLIPNLVETVKGYKQYEQKLLKEVTDIRSKLTKSENPREKGKLESGLSQALKSIFAVAEAYPELKANQNFINLQNTLTEIEDQIQLARRYYNGSVRDYNILVQSFPANVVAGAFNFKEGEFFEVDYATERKVPDVKF